MAKSFISYPTGNTGCVRDGNSLNKDYVNSSLRSLGEAGSATQCNPGASESRVSIMALEQYRNDTRVSLNDLNGASRRGRPSLTWGTQILTRSLLPDALNRSVERRKPVVEVMRR